MSLIQEYEEKAPRVIAGQFTGGPENGPALVDWVVSSGGTAVWLDPLPETESTAAREESLRISSPKGNYTVLVGDYVVKDKEGNFEKLTSDEFFAKYEQNV